MLAGERPLYFTESWGHEPLFHYAQAAVMAVTQECDWSLRLPAVVCGTLTVLTTWLAARRLFSARVALLAAAALTVSFWSIFYSREGSRVVGVTPFFGLMVYFLGRGLERLRDPRPAQRRRRAGLDFFLAGLGMGIPVYVYVAGRVALLLWATFALYLALFHRRHFQRAWWGVLLCGLVGVALAAPLFLLLYRNPGMEQRIGHLADASTALREGDPGPLFSLGVQALGMFVWRGERDWLYNVYGRPIFDPLTGACFALGVLLCIRRWKQARCALLLLWLATGIGPAVVVPPAASLTHTIAVQPAAYILLAVGIEALWCRASGWRRWAGPVLAAGLVAFHGALSYRAYFLTWANAPEVRELYQGGITAVARELDDRDPPGPVAVGAPYVNYWHPWNAVAFDLTLRRSDLDVRWFNPAGGWVWPAGEGPITYYFPVDPLGPQAFDPLLERLFKSDAVLRPSATDDFAVFQVAYPATLEERLLTVADAPLAWPPDLDRLPQPALPLVFGDRFALLGAELQEAVASPGVELRLITYWKVLVADASPVVSFVHLTSDGRDVWGQHDWLDVWPAGLCPGDRFAQVHRLPIAPETPPGLYHVQLGLYGPDTLVRLPIAAGTEGTADRVWVGQVEVTE
ncbi:MAG: hypothetical protein DRI48_01970 [Chloroflexi bacterium]|nr:MAG: hypothetical protein DRI48_01970 [Chloroflexota bacterium]